MDREFDILMRKIRRAQDAGNHYACLVLVGRLRRMAGITITVEQQYTARRQRGA